MNSPRYTQTTPKRKIIKITTNGISTDSILSNNATGFKVKKPDDSKIDPQLASKVVQDYLLPMFNDIGSMRTQSKLKSTTRLNSSSTKIGNQKERPTVFSELKLTDVL